MNHEGVLVLRTGFRAVTAAAVRAFEAHRAYELERRGICDDEAGHPMTCRCKIEVTESPSDEVTECGCGYGACTMCDVPITREELEALDPTFEELSDEVAE